MKVLEQRLRNRNTDSDEVIMKRLQGAKLEMSKRTLYDYVVVNDQIPKVVARIERILARRRIKC
jgi:guanylate kinase